MDTYLQAPAPRKVKLFSALATPQKPAKVVKKKKAKPAKADGLFTQPRGRPPHDEHGCKKVWDPVNGRWLVNSRMSMSDAALVDVFAQ